MAGTPDEARGVVPQSAGYRPRTDLYGLALVDLSAAGKVAQVEAVAPALVKRAVNSPSLRLEVVMAWAWERRQAGRCDSAGELASAITDESAARVDLLPLELGSHFDPAAVAAFGATHSGVLQPQETLTRLRAWLACP
jgi:hypothetical protein